MKIAFDAPRGSALLLLSCVALLAACGPAAQGSQSNDVHGDDSSPARVTLSVTATPSIATDTQQVTFSVDAVATTRVSADVTFTVVGPDGNTAFTATSSRVELFADTQVTVQQAMTVASSDARGVYTVSVTAARSGSTSVLSDVPATTTFQIDAPPGGDQVPAGVRTVTIGSATHVVDGVDVPRLQDQLIIYTPIAQSITPTNFWGAEVVVIGGKVASVTDRQSTQGPAIAIPSNGYVLSGHNTARDWLLAHATVGATVTLSTNTVPATDGGTSTSTDGGTATDGGTQPGGVLPAKVFGIYFFMYNSPRLATIQAQAPRYNVVYYAFALGTNNGGAVTFSVPAAAGGDANFRTDIAAWKSSGRVALLSIGGGSDTGLRLTNSTQGTQFVNTITPIIDSYGFQGIDWDLEGGGGQFNAATVVAVSRELKTRYGPNFVISLVPRPYEFRSGGSELYRSIATQLGSQCDLVGFQWYDYPEATNASQQLSIIRNDITDAIQVIPASKIVIGGEAPNAGLAWSPASVYRDAYIENDNSTGGIRGAFVWDSPNEQSSGWAFANTVGPAVLGH